MGLRSRPSFRAAWRRVRELRDTVLRMPWYLLMEHHRRTYLQLPGQYPQRDRERPQAWGQRRTQYRLGRQQPYAVLAGELPRVRRGSGAILVPQDQQG